MNQSDQSLINDHCMNLPYICARTERCIHDHCTRFDHGAPRMVIILCSISIIRFFLKLRCFCDGILPSLWSARSVGYVNFDDRPFYRKLVVCATFLFSLRRALCFWRRDVSDYVISLGQVERKLQLTVER